MVVTAPLEQAEAPDRLDLLVHLVLQGLVGLLEHQEALVLLGQEDLLEPAVLRGLQALVVHLELRGLQEQVALVPYMQAALLLL